MNSEKESGAPPESGAGAPPEPRPSRDREELLHRRETLIPTIAVTAVAIAAVATAVMVKRADMAEGERAVLGPPQQRQTQVATAPAAATQPKANEQASSETTPVVQAPPLKPTPKAAARTPNTAPRESTSALGGNSACNNCGVVEMVVAVHDYAKPKPKGYQMHIRMDDGTVRTVQQRGALAAGSRVVVENGSVRPLTQPG